MTSVVQTLEQIERVLVEKRDAINAILAVVRRARNKVASAEEIQKKLQSLGIPGKLQDAEAIMQALQPFMDTVSPQHDAVAPSLPKKPAKGSKKARKQAKRSRPAKRGISRHVLSFMRSVFSSSEKAPATLEEALERAFGPEWSSKTLHVPHVMKGGKMEMRRTALDQDLAKGSSSHFRSLIGSAVRVLESYVGSADGSSFPGATRNLADAISAREKMTLIKETAARWGVSL